MPRAKGEQRDIVLQECIANLGRQGAWSVLTDILRITGILFLYFFIKDCGASGKEPAREET